MREPTRRPTHSRLYIMQLLQSTTNPDSYALYTRWGRVGASGQIILQEPLKSAASAQKLFTKKFKSKTGVEWSERETATPQKGLWRLHSLVEVPTSSQGNIYGLVCCKTFLPGLPLTSPDREYDADDGPHDAPEPPVSKLAQEIQVKFILFPMRS